MDYAGVTGLIKTIKRLVHVAKCFQHFLSVSNKYKYEWVAFTFWLFDQGWIGGVTKSKTLTRNKTFGLEFWLAVCGEAHWCPSKVKIHWKRRPSSVLGHCARYIASQGIYYKYNDIQIKWGPQLGPKQWPPHSNENWKYTTIVDLRAIYRTNEQTGLQSIVDHLAILWSLNTGRLRQWLTNGARTINSVPVIGLGLIFSKLSITIIRCCILATPILNFALASIVDNFNN